MRALIAAAILALSLSVAAVPAVFAGSIDVGAEATLATLVNREHARVCGPSLFRAPQLNAVARWRAQDMLDRDYFSHTILGTANKAWDYFAKYGNTQSNGSGENIGWNNYPDDISASVVYQMFMNSAGHRALIQSCFYNTFGVGSYKADNGKHMYVVLFTKQPVERVIVWRAPVRSGPGIAYPRLRYVYIGQRQYVFRHAYRLGIHWDYGYFPGNGWGWVRDSKTR